MNTTETAPVTNIENPEVAQTANPIIKIKNLCEKAIVIQLQIGKFSGSRIDTRVTKDVANDEHTSTDYVKVTKSLMKSEQSKKVQNAEQKLRSEFYKMTAPWSREGEGVCKITKYLDIKSKLEELSREYYSAVDDLVANYDNIVNADKLKLGNMFNAADYPSAQGFKSRFYVKIDVKPIEKSDFRSGVLDDNEINSINNQIEERLAKSMADAQRDNLNRIKEKLSHLFDRVVDTNAKFHSSCISNAIEEIQTAKDLNVNDMPELDKLFDDLTNTLSKYDADSVRANSNVRIEVAENTKDALDRINETMKCFM